MFVAICFSDVTNIIDLEKIKLYFILTSYFPEIKLTGEVILYFSIEIANCEFYFLILFTINLYKSRKIHDVDQSVCLHFTK